MLDILIIVVSGFVIWFVTKRITRPISELTLLSTKMSELDFETKYQSHAGNEIDELGRKISTVCLNSWKRRLRQCLHTWKRL